MCVCNTFNKGGSQMLESEHEFTRASVVTSQSSRRLSFGFSRLSLWKNKDFQVHAASSWFIRSANVAATNLICDNRSKVQWSTSEICIRNNLTMNCG